jgi:hypothetical protein
VGFVVDKVAQGQVFSEYFGFPLQIFISPIAPQSASSIIWIWYNRSTVAALPSGPKNNGLGIIIIIKIFVADTLIVVLLGFLFKHFKYVAFISLVDVGMSMFRSCNNFFL